MSKAPSMPVFTDALLGDTTHLSTEEFGAYCLILFVTWRNNAAPLPDDPVRMARICRVSMKRWMGRLRPILVGFFDLSEGTWRQHRLEKEWRYVQKVSAVRSKSGKLGAEAKSLKNNNTSQANASAELKQNASTHTHTHTVLTSIADAIEDSPKSAPLGHDPSADEASLRTGDPQTTDGQVDDDSRSIPEPQSQDPNASFGEWWQHVPHKVSKGHAEKAYRSAVKGGATPADLLTGIQRYARQVAGNDPRYIKHPSTWLNGKCWLDEPPPPAMQSPKGFDHEQRDRSRGGSTRQHPDSLFAGILERDLAGRA
ncbi:uncharacterized protein YdaU (DUF1376 family) [Azospirillum baldaniorum]|uniref:YdaU family protein n=1 Tax=Azospirillum baldaniorum TaxID=1064539 RepID=UPI0011AC5B37|nr:YdaU family protein [Azospirillum baldaniorum]TWA71891.1 uncharacterized protein YdaU (DUF1376 family) [Azospirillum baldaniorum]